MARPSPRTQGITPEGETFQKFGTQQLKFIDPAHPALGVKQIDTGKSFKGFTTSVSKALGIDFGAPTPFSQQIQAGVTGAYQGAPLRPQTPTENGTGCECEACKNGTGQCSDKVPCCDAWDIGCELFGCKDKHGCECEACKNGTGQCSDKVPHCDAWDVGCEVGTTITDPIGSWWDKYGIWVYVILGVIGLGVLLWLLRPLFGIIGAFKGGAP